MKINCNYINLYKYNNDRDTNQINYSYKPICAYDVFFKGHTKSKDFEFFDFVKRSDTLFFTRAINSGCGITEKEIIDNLNKISKMDSLEGHNKLNLIEHVITKKMRGENRDFDKLIDNIKYFSNNDSLNSVIIADSSKYLLEVPNINRDEFNEVLSFVVKTASFNDAASVMKIAKLINSSTDKKQLLLSLLKDGYNASQIKCIASIDEDLLNKLRQAKNINDLDTNTKFEYFKLLSNTNQKAVDSKLKNILSIFPANNNELVQLKSDLISSFSAESPLVLGYINLFDNFKKHPNLNEADSHVVNFCNAIFTNNKPLQGVSSSIFYEQKAFQSIFDLKKYNLSYEQQNKIYKIVKCFGELIDDNSPFNPFALALNLRYKNTFELLKSLPQLDFVDTTKLKQVSLAIDFLKNNTNCIVSSDFQNEKFYYKTFIDGTRNKIIEYNYKNKDNPNVFLHAAGIELAGLLPNVQSVDSAEKLYNANSNKIFSTTFLSGNDFKPFRSYGYILNSDYDDILGGVGYDLASGFDKTIENFAAFYLKEKSNIFTYFPMMVKKKLKLTDLEYIELVEKIKNGDKKSSEIIKAIQSHIGATERIDGRRYNEFLLLNPIITGVYVYGNIESLPYDFRKFAQDNDLSILHIKTRDKCKKDINI